MADHRYQSIRHLAPEAPRHQYEQMLRNLALDDLDRGRPRLSEELKLFRFRTWPHVAVLEEAQLDEVVAWLDHLHGAEWSPTNLAGSWKIWFRIPVVVWIRTPELHTEMVLRWL